VAILLVATAFIAAGAISFPGSGKGTGEAVPNFGGESLVVVNYGGTFSSVWQKYVIAPFEAKYNAKIIQETGLTFDTLAKMRAQKDNPQIDVWMMADSGAVIAKRENLIQPLDPNAIPNLKLLIPKARKVGDPYADFLFTSTVIAYNKNFVKTPPKSWLDLWKPEYKGKVILPDINTCCGNLFLMQMSKLNGGNIDYNIQPGFKKIESLKHSVLAFWNSQDQAANLLVSGQAWIGVWSADRAGTQAFQGAPIGLAFPKEGVTLLGNSIGITKGTKHLKLAQAYVNFALDAAQQRQVDENAILQPTNSKVRLSPRVAQYAPSASVLKKSFTPNWTRVAINMPAWTAQWERDVTSP